MLTTATGNCDVTHKRSQGAPCPPKFLENIVILCFEKRFSKQNRVIRLRSNILPPTNFWAGYATDCKKRNLQWE